MNGLKREIPRVTAGHFYQRSLAMGTKCLNWMIYRDVEDNGESFTVYDDKGNWIGNFLAGSETLDRYISEGAPITEGIDNRQ